MEDVMTVRLHALLVASFALPFVAHAAPKTAIPALLEQARYVALGYDVGDGVVYTNQISAIASETLPEERRALDAIRRDLEKWGRYVVTNRPEHADILIVVRMGRRSSLEIGSGQSAGGRPMSSRAIGGQLSSGEDRIAVYEAVRGRPGISLWSAAQTDGLAGSPPPLYKSFREEVEASAKKP
jgi:hypothetical protein